jgi:hypothetical protein
VQPASPSWPILQAADLVLLVGGTDRMGLAATLEWADHLGRVAPGMEGLPADATRLVLVAPPGAGRHGSPSRLSAELGDRLAGQLPWDPASVDLLRRGAALRHRSLRRSGLATAAQALAMHVTTHQPGAVAGAAERARTC